MDVVAASSDPKGVECGLPRAVRRAYLSLGSSEVHPSSHPLGAADGAIAKRVLSWHMVQEKYNCQS